MKHGSLSKAQDSALPLYEVHTLEEAVSRSLGTRRLTNNLLLGFATAALLLAAVGIYGVIALNVSQRAMLSGVDPMDPLIFGGLALVRAAVALAARSIPARRATATDPLVAPRYE